MEFFGGEFGSVTKKLAQDERKQNLDKLLNQESRQVLDLSTAHEMTEEQKSFYSVDKALEEEYQIRDILVHAKSMKLTESQETQLKVQFNRNENFRLINRGKKMTGDSTFMTNVKTAIANYEASLHKGIYGSMNENELSEQGAKDYVESQTKTQLQDAILCCKDVIKHCGKYLERGSSIWFWRKNRYVAVENALHRAENELKQLEELQKKGDIGEYTEDLKQQDSLLTWMNQPALEAKRKKREAARNTKYNNELKDISTPKMDEYDSQMKAKQAAFKDMKVSRTPMMAACNLSFLRNMDDSDLKLCGALLNEKIVKEMPEEKKKAKLQYVETIFEEILKADLKEFNFNDYKELFGEKFNRNYHLLKLAYDADDIFKEYRSLLNGDDKGLLALNKEQFAEVEAKRDALMGALPYMEKAHIVAKDPRFQQKNIYQELDRPYMEILARTYDDDEKITDGDYYKALAAIKAGSLTKDEKTVLFGPGMDINVLYQDLRKRRSLKEGQAGDSAALNAILEKQKTPLVYIEKEKERITKETKEREENERLDKESGALIKDIVAMKVERHYAEEPSENIMKRSARYGDKFEKKKEKTEADLKELEKKASEKAAFEEGAAKEAARIEKILKDAKADEFPGISEESKKYLAGLMGDNAEENHELLKNYAKGGSGRQSALLKLVKRYMQIDTSKVDFSSTEKMIKQMDRLEKLTNAHYSLLFLLELNADILHKKDDLKAAILKKTTDVHGIAAIYNNRKNLVTNKLYAESLDSEIGHRYNPHTTPEQAQMLRMLDMDLYGTLEAQCFIIKDQLPTEFPKDDEEHKKMYKELSGDVQLACRQEFSKNESFGYQQSKHYSYLSSLANLKENQVLFKGIVKEDIRLEDDSSESVVRNLANFANLKPVDHMSKDEIESLFHRMLYRVNGDMTAEEKKRITDIRFQAYREMRDIMLAHMDYVMEKYGNGYAYLSPEEMKEHGEEILKDFHCNTNIREFMKFCMKHKELYTDQQEKIAKVLQFVTFIGGENFFKTLIHQGLDNSNDPNASMDKAYANAMHISVGNNMFGNNALNITAVRDVFMYTKKPDKVKWDHKYEDKLQHKTWDKEELEKLKKESVESYNELGKYKIKKKRQENIATLKENDTSLLQMMLQYKKDTSKPKLTDKEAVNLFFFRHYIDEQSTKQIVDLYINRNKDKDSVNKVISIVSENMHRIAAPVLQIQRETPKGMFVTYPGEAKDAANAVYRMDKMVKELFPDAVFSEEDTALIENMKKVDHNNFSDDMRIMDYIKLGYTTDEIANDYREIAADKEKERKAKAK